MVGQGPTVLAVAAGWGCLHIFSLIYHFSFSLSLGDGPIETEILYQRAVEPKQPTNQAKSMYFSGPNYAYNVFNDLIAVVFSYCFESYRQQKIVRIYHLKSSKAVVILLLNN